MKKLLGHHAARLSTTVFLIPSTLQVHATGKGERAPYAQLQDRQMQPFVPCGIIHQTSA